MNGSKDICGSCLITFEMSPALGGLIYWIQSVYVKPECRKQGYFRALYNKVVEIARKDPLGHSVRLYVDKDNKNA